MATGGYNTSDDDLDLSEVNAEIKKLDKSSGSDITDSLDWENSQADLAYDGIAKESDRHDFLGFPTLTSTPIKTKSASDIKYQSALSSQTTSGEISKKTLGLREVHQRAQY